MNILIVDDYATNRKLLRAQLEGEGHSVIEAVDGVAALAMLEREPVDAIVSDILMPRLDGYQFCRKVRQHPKFSALPLILYTSTYDSVSDRHLAQTVGADRYLLKPAPVEIILDALHEAIHKACAREPPQSPRPDEAHILHEYSEALVHKLEERNAELQAALEESRRTHEVIRELNASLHQAYNDLRETQATVMQEERLRALGQMASGIAHDINNALSPVSLYVESMLETERNLSTRGRGYLETIQRAVDDVAQTVARMREFYRQREQQMELTPVQLNRMVQQVLDLTKARWSDQLMQSGIVIRAQTELAPELPEVMGVESEIREALTNLVFNAVDAMPEGGTLTLRTRRVDTDPEHPAVAVEVVDTGAGMDEDTRRRCLEPFFTTKGERGTGLGLAMVFGMVQRHSAELEIDSAPGAGTTVRLVFAVPTAVQTETGQPVAALQAPSRLRLLLIDDDPMLIKSLQDTLETDGHVIVTASGGEAGIAAFRASLARGERFAAVITDLGMPYVDGRQVATAIKQTSPETPVIMLTGWGLRLVAENDIPLNVDRVLAKPPKLRELSEALARLCQSTTTEPTP